MKKATKDDINIIKEAFIEHYSDAVTELNYKNDWIYKGRIIKNFLSHLQIIKNNP